MSTSIGDAFLLSSYSVPHKLASYSGGPSKLSNVHATYHDGLSTEGHVLVAAQGDGVHVLDVSLQTVLCKSCSPSGSPCHLQIDFNYDIEDALFQT